MKKIKKLTVQEANIIYSILFPEDGRLPSRPDILYSLSGEWPGWVKMLNSNDPKDLVTDKEFKKAWKIIFGR